MQTQTPTQIAPAAEIFLIVTPEGPREYPMDPELVALRTKAVAALEKAAKAMPHPQSWPSLHDLRTHADTLGYSFRRSPSLMKRKDTSLKGTIVLLANCNSHDAIIQGELAELLAPGVKAGKDYRRDKLLVEASPSHDLLGRFHASRNWEPLDTCIGIDDDALRGALATSSDEAYARGLALLETLGALGSQAATLELERRAMSLDLILLTWLREDEAMKEDTLADCFEFQEAIDTCLVKARELEERLSKHFLERILANAGADHATYVILGAAHVKRIMEELLAKHDVVVLARKSHLGVLSQDPKSLASWEESATPAKA